MPKVGHFVGLMTAFVMEDRFYWLTMKLLSKIIGPFESMEPGKD